MKEKRRMLYVSSQCRKLEGKYTVHIIFSGEPELVDQLILTLGLGSNGQHISPAGSVSDPAVVLSPFISFILPSPPLNVTQ